MIATSYNVVRSIQNYSALIFSSSPSSIDPCSRADSVILLFFIRLSYLILTCLVLISVDSFASFCLSISLFKSMSVCLSPPPSLSFSLPLFSLSLFLSLSLSVSFSLSLSLSLSLSRGTFTYFSLYYFLYSILILPSSIPLDSTLKRQKDIFLCVLQ